MNGKSVRVGARLLVGDIVKMVKFYRDVLGIRNFYVADSEGNLLEIGSMNEIPVS